MNKVNYLNVSVYRFPFGDCTNRGVSSYFDELALACKEGPWSFDADEAIPLNFCAVEMRDMGDVDYFDIIPATIDENGKTVARPGWWSYGGNIADDSDARFRELTGIRYPLHIHDRRE